MKSQHLSRAFCFRHRTRRIIARRVGRAPLGATTHAHFFHHRSLDQDDRRICRSLAGVRCRPRYRRAVDAPVAHQSAIQAAEGDIQTGYAPQCLRSGVLCQRQISQCIGASSIRDRFGAKQVQIAKVPVRTWRVLRSRWLQKIVESLMVDRTDKRIRRIGLAMSRSLACARHAGIGGDSRLTRMAR